MHKAILIFFSCALLLGACRGKKESIYVLASEDETRTLTLRKDGTFLLEVRAGYYNRIDTGTYDMRADTLALNQDKSRPELDSVVVIDSLYNGARFLEIFEEEVVVDYGVITQSSYNPPIFPTVVVNDSIPLSLNPDDQSYHKLLIPDTLELQKVRVTRFENNTCKPSITVEKKLPASVGSTKSILIYLRSYERPEHYLSGFKWLVKGDTIESFFQNENCESLELKFVKK